MSWVPSAVPVVGRPVRSPSVRRAPLRATTQARVRTTDGVDGIAERVGQRVARVRGRRPRRRRRAGAGGVEHVHGRGHDRAGVLDVLDARRDQQLLLEPELAAGGDGRGEEQVGEGAQAGERRDLGGDVAVGRSTACSGGRQVLVGDLAQRPQGPLLDGGHQRAARREVGVQRRRWRSRAASARAAMVTPVHPVGVDEVAGQVEQALAAAPALAGPPVPWFRRCDVFRWHVGKRRGPGRPVQGLPREEGGRGSPRTVDQAGIS